MTSPDLSIIIVSWNVRELLRACLHSIDRQRYGLALEVIVVDGASSDDSPAMVRETFPWVKLIACNENIGFPRGNNIGLAEANGRYLLLLNPDTEIKQNALPVMIDYLANHADVGLVGPQLLNSDGTIQSSRRRFPTLATALFESTWLEPFAPRRILRHYYAQDLPDDEISEVDWVTGACMLTRREIFNTIGGLDEAYFMYSEELDWCHRIKDAGWRIVYDPSAQVLHHVGKSSEQAVTARHINFQRAKLRYFRKFHGGTAVAVLRTVLLFNYIGQLIVEGLKGIVGHKRPLRWQRVQAYWQVIRTGLRPAGY
ncbi:MAG: glycosyltransferase family 2 protein [Ardenticatenaceae bacterium]|nr:glycosyltransferase family 2 protein [Ardenticatenaceae bacterium]MCB9445572.1 glycosyltransferase family 2 protein [Ardenticatenaceae bacterium]